VDKDIAKRLTAWKNDPIAFFVEALGIPKAYVWGKMKEMCETVALSRKIAIKAGHGVSKSFSVARLCLWYLYTHYPATIFTTAPSHNQVENILWREIRDALNKAAFQLGGKITTTKLELEDKWFAIGFATKPDQGQENATKIQGLHNEHVMIIFDEAAGIIKPIWEAKEGLMTNEKAKFIAIGNPTQATGEFVDCFNDPTYEKITISVFDSPNYKAGTEIIPGLSGKEFVESIRHKYGEDSNQWKSRVLGEIPDANADGLLTKQWIREAEEAKYKESDQDEDKRFVVWDVADGGEDAHVIKSYVNMNEVESIEVLGRKIEEVEPKVWRALRKIRGNCIVVDADGIGRVATEFLEGSADINTEIIPFEGSSKDVDDEDMFRNKRDQGHWKMRDAFVERKIKIIPNQNARNEYQTLRLMDNPRGLIQMEPKKDIKKRISRSPGHSDCTMMMCSEYEDIPVSETPEDNDPYGYRSRDSYVFKNHAMAV